MKPAFINSPTFTVMPRFSSRGVMPAILPVISSREVMSMAMSSPGLIALLVVRHTFITIPTVELTSLLTVVEVRPPFEVIEPLFEVGGPWLDRFNWGGEEGESWEVCWGENSSLNSFLKDRLLLLLEKGGLLLLLE